MTNGIVTMVGWIQWLVVVSLLVWLLLRRR